MENGTLVVGERFGVGRPVGLRIASVITAIALVFAMFVLVQERADAAPGASVAAAVSLPSVDAQIDTGALIRAIVCPILLRLAATFPIIRAIINALLVRFGCLPSPGAP